jgi:acetyltransferase-like isoleucine patch superfamily enzyme
MKNAFQTILKFFISLFSYVYTPKNNERFSQYWNSIYTHWIYGEFKSIGGQAFIQRPICIKGGKYISIGKFFYSRSRLRIEAWDYYKGFTYNPKIIIGNNVIINFDCHIGAINEIRIGNNVLIASRVFITDHYHGEITNEALQKVPADRPLFSKGSVIIEDNVWIGEGAVILGNLVIGRNSIIGANAVVTKSFPANSVIGGIPAQLIKNLNS